MKRFIVIFMLLFLTSCANVDSGPRNTDNQDENKEPAVTDTKKNMETLNNETSNNESLNIASLINENGNTVQERIKVPDGFERVKADDGSYGQYLRSRPVKPDGTEIKLYNGDTVNKDVHVAVLDIDVGNRDLQQCADAVIRLRAEYLYSQGLYHEIHFRFTNGFNADYPTWMNGGRISIEGNKASWVKKTGYSDEYSSFRKYLDVVFAYAGSLSLSKEMKNVAVEDMRIGDVFIKGDTPGHAVIILDMAGNKSTGEKIFMIAQSYMPAQDIHILKNLQNDTLSPWYPVDFGESLSTPQWGFTKDQLMRFEE